MLHLHYIMLTIERNVLQYKYTCSNNKFTSQLKSPELINCTYIPHCISVLFGLGFFGHIFKDASAELYTFFYGICRLKVSCLCTKKIIWKFSFLKVFDLHLALTFNKFSELPAFFRCLNWPTTFQQGTVGARVRYIA